MNKKDFIIFLSYITEPLAKYFTI